ncbi:MAG: ATP-binding protein [Clostridiales bacterium]
MSLLKEILNGESKTMEFKEILPKSEMIAKTIVAFSNTSGGKLIIGVNDQREVIGISEKEDVFELQDSVSSMIYDSCYPNIIPEIYTQNIEGKVLLMIEIFRGNLLPYYIKKEGKNNGVYIRIGATNRKASYENIVDLERQKRNISFDEEINREIEFESLNLKPIKKKFEEIGKKIDLEKLLNLKLVKEENKKIIQQMLC